MGKKARNAGKKPSKTCDKLATAKSVNPNGKIGRVSKKTTYYMVRLPLNHHSELFVETMLLILWSQIL